MNSSKLGCDQNSQCRWFFLPSWTRTQIRTNCFCAAPELNFLQVLQVLQSFIHWHSDSVQDGQHTTFVLTKPLRPTRLILDQRLHPLGALQWQSRQIRAKGNRQRMAHVEVYHGVPMLMGCLWAQRHKQCLVRSTCFFFLNMTIIPYHHQVCWWSPPCVPFYHSTRRMSISAIAGEISQVDQCSWDIWMVLEKTIQYLIPYAGAHPHFRQTQWATLYQGMFIAVASTLSKFHLGDLSYLETLVIINHRWLYVNCKYCYYHLLLQILLLPTYPLATSGIIWLLFFLGDITMLVVIKIFWLTKMTVYFG